MNRVATFQPVAYKPRNVSLLHLAKIGLQCDTENGTVYCRECGTSHEADVALNPPDGYEYHAPRCSHSGSTVAVLPEANTVSENPLFETTSGSGTNYLFEKLFTFTEDHSLPCLQGLDPLYLAENGYNFVGPLNKLQCWECGTTRLPHIEGSLTFLKNIDCFRCKPYVQERITPGLFNIPSTRQKRCENEFDCLMSFCKNAKQWRAHDMLQPSELAKRLYYYTGNGDVVACCVCDERRCPSDEGIETFRANMACPKCEANRRNSQLSSQEILETARDEQNIEVLQDVSTYGISVQPANIAQMKEDMPLLVVM